MPNDFCLANPCPLVAKCNVRKLVSWQNLPCAPFSHDSMCKCDSSVWPFAPFLILSPPPSPKPRSLCLSC